LLASFQLASADKGVDMSELQVHQCMTPEHVNLALVQCECHIGK